MPIIAIPLPSSGFSYLDLAEAADLLEALPGLAAFRAATDDARAAALDQATLDIDSAMPYQGRKLEPNQPLEFPRLFQDSLGATAVDPSTVWDWDPATAAAIVPGDVRRATLFQADSILAGTREDRLDLEHDGVAYKQTGEDAESFKATPTSGSFTAQGPGTGLCRRAWILLRRYRLRSGRLG